MANAAEPETTLGWLRGPQGDELALCDGEGRPLAGQMAGTLKVEACSNARMRVTQTFIVRRVTDKEAGPNGR